MKIKFFYKENGKIIIPCHIAIIFGIIISLIGFYLNSVLLIFLPFIIMTILHFEDMTFVIMLKKFIYTIREK